MRRRRPLGRRKAVPSVIFILFLLMLINLAGVEALAATLILCGFALAVGGVAAYLIIQRKKKINARPKAAPAPAPEPVRAEPPQQAEKKSPYSPEVQAIIDDGKLAMKEMGRLYSSIHKPEIRTRINEIMSVSDKIVRDAIDDPTDVPQIRKFLDYYLPTTIKLLNAYDRMSSQEVSGENITGSMQRIEDMLDTTVTAYEKQLDSLFANQAADIQMDIEIMNGMLAREGLGGKSYLDLNEFMKQYDKQQQYKDENLQKGSTSNG